MDGFEGGALRLQRGGAVDSRLDSVCGRHALCVHRLLRYFKVSRYAVICAFCRSVRCMAGIKLPGLKVFGSAIHACRLPGVLSVAPAASVARLIKWVRSGP